VLHFYLILKHSVDSLFLIKETLFCWMEY